MGLEALGAGVEFVERVWLADAVRPGAEVFARRGLSAAFQLVDLRVRPAEPLRKLRAGEPAARRGYAQLTQAQSEGLAGLPEVRTLRPFALVGGAELSRERVVGHGAVDCGVADLAVPQYFGWLGDDLDVVEDFLVVEAEHGYDAAVEDPEVLFREVEFSRVLPPQVSRVLARGGIAPRMRQEKALALGRRVVDDADAADVPASGRLAKDLLAPLAVEVARRLAGLDECGVSGVLAVGGVAAPGLEVPGRGWDSRAAVTAKIVRPATSTGVVLGCWLPLPALSLMSLVDVRTVQPRASMLP